MFPMTPFTLQVLGSKGHEQQRPAHTPPAAGGIRELLASFVAYGLGFLDVVFFFLFFFLDVVFNKQALKVCSVPGPEEYKGRQHVLPPVV